MKGKFLGAFLFVLLVSVALAAALSAVRTRSASAEQRFQTVTVVVGDIVKRVSAPCTIEALDAVSIGSQVSGTISRVMVKYGDPVKAGDLLVEIDPTLLRSQLEEARAAREIAFAARRNALLALDRNKRLVDVGFVSAATLDQVLKEVDEARARVAASEAQVRRAETDLANTMIRAPIDGIVLKRLVEPGQTIAATFQTPVLVQLGRSVRQLKVEAFISEFDYDSVINSAAVEVRPLARPPQRILGSLLQVRPSGASSPANAIQGAQGMSGFVAEVLIENPEPQVLPGMTCTSEFVSRPSNLLRVPLDALRFKPKDYKKRDTAVEPADQVVFVRRGKVFDPVRVRVEAIDSDVAGVSASALRSGDEVAIGYTSP